MNYVRQFGIILLVTLAGEALSALLPLPVPASMYGIVLLFLCLLTGVLRVSQIREVSAFLVEMMPVLFVPAGVGLMESVGLLRGSVAAYAAVTLVSTVAVMGAAGRVTQAVIRRQAREEAKRDE